MARMTRRCLDCDPLSHDPRHISDLVTWRVDRYLDILYSPLKRFGLLRMIERAFIPLLLNLCRFLHVFREVDITSNLELKIYNRTLVIFREAQKRGMMMKVFTCFGKCTKFFSLEVGGKKIIFDELPTLSLRSDDVPFSDKYILKQELKKREMPTPDGTVCTTLGEAIKVAQFIGYPLVVKPRHGSLSKHTTCGIGTEDDLRYAVKSAKMIAREFMVERHVSGDVFRVTVVGGRVGGCCLREAPHVTGDGINTVVQLVAQKNADPRRGPAHQKNSTLHHISLTSVTYGVLAAQGMTMDSVPGKGEKAILHSKVILGAGADIHDCTDTMHPENKKLFEDAAKICGAPLIGFDALFQDISKSWRVQECGIIEANSKPYIDMHHVPVTGKPRDIAKLLIDYLITQHI